MIFRSLGQFGRGTAILVELEKPGQNLCIAGVFNFANLYCTVGQMWTVLQWYCGPKYELRYSVLDLHEITFKCSILYSNNVYYSVLHYSFLMYC